MMKTKLFTNMLVTIVTLFTALFALPQTTQAQTIYDLKIADADVTSANCNNLLVLPGVYGKVKYDPATKTLTLDNATIEGGEASAITSNINGLTIKLIGTNTVTSDFFGIEHYKPMTITGDGTLNVESTATIAIYVVNTALIIDGCTVNAKGTFGISGTYEADETLIIGKATVTADGDRMPFQNFKTFILDGSEITSPKGAVWNNEKHTITDASGNVIKSQVVIEPKAYNLLIAEKNVTNANCNDLSVIPGVSGKVYYDPATNTLTLDNATIKGNQYGIASHIDGLTVNLIGTNTVSSPNAAVWHTMPMTITGGGTLNVESTMLCGLYTEKTSLTIEGCIVNAKGKWGIAGYDVIVEALTIKNATVTAEGTNGSICDFKTFTLDGSEITIPAGAVWNDEQHAITDASGNIITGQVVIEPKAYPIWICGKQVTSVNCNDLSVLPGVSGKVNYDPATNILTLDNASILGGKEGGITSSIDDLTIKLIGTNTVTADYFCIDHTKPMTITGGGTLNVESKDYMGITNWNNSLTIDGCTVNAKGLQYGIGGYSDKNETLTIRNAKVTAEGSEASIARFKTFTLDGSEITSPKGAVWNDAKHAITDASGNVITSQVVIEPKAYNLLIAGKNITSANCNDLSVIPGVSGKVYYDPATNTLTLDNATIKGDLYGIASHIDGLTVNLIGTNTVSSPNAAVWHTMPMTITGGGTLNVESTMLCGLYTEKTPLTIDGCIVNAKGKWGIAGYDVIVEALTIKNATVTAEGTNGSICDFKTFTLDGSEITSPEGAVWNDVKHAITDASGNVITSKIEIAPASSDLYDVVLEEHNGEKIPCIKVVRELTGLELQEAKDLVESVPCIVLENLSLAEAEAVRDKLNAAGGTAKIYLHGTSGLTDIEAVIVDVPAHKQGVYNLQGVRLGNDLDRLPAGVYIVDGKKVVKK